MVIIPHPWKDNPLEYLVKINFPLERNYKASVPSLSAMRPSIRDDDYLRRASDYRKELGQISYPELLVLAEEAAKAEAQKAIAKRDTEEANRFFNLPHADVDIAHWSRMSVWSLDEAVALSLGKDPRKVNWDRVKDHVDDSRFAAIYRAQRQIFHSAKIAGQLWDSTIPGVFLAWAERMNVEMPPALVDAIKALGVQIADWKSAYERQKATAEKAEAEALEEKKASIKLMADHGTYIQKLSIDYSKIIDGYRAKISDLEQTLSQQIEAVKAAQVAPPKSKGKSFGARERESLLKLVIGMAVEAYRYDPKANRSDIIGEIAGDLEKVGIPLDADTVRKYLYEARDLLPPPETEHKR